MQGRGSKRDEEEGDGTADGEDLGSGQERDGPLPGGNPGAKHPRGAGPGEKQVLERRGQGGLPRGAPGLPRWKASGPCGSNLTDSRAGRLRAWRARQETGNGTRQKRTRCTGWFSRRYRVNTGRRSVRRWQRAAWKASCANREGGF